MYLLMVLILKRAHQMKQLLWFAGFVSNWDELPLIQTVLSKLF
jgi:hypothetical protein